MTILLTGSSGTIGSRLFETLLKLDYDVIGLDRRENYWNPNLNKRTIQADLLQLTDYSKIPSNVDTIIHFAANARVYELVKSPRLALENLETISNILEYSRQHNIRRFIFSSSREVYGNCIDDTLMVESMAGIERCENPYSASKISGEAMVHAYQKTFGLDFVIVRFSNVYGMYDDSDRVIPIWIKRALTDQDIVIYGADKILDFTYIDDAVSGVLKTIEHFDNITGETFNIASFGKGKQLHYVANKITSLLSSKSKIVIAPNRVGEVAKFQADISKAIKHLDYQPKVGIDEGLEKCVNWYSNYFRTTRRLVYA